METKKHLNKILVYGDKLVKTEMMEVIIPANTNNAPKTKILLPDIQNIRDAHLWHIKPYYVDNFPDSPTTGTAMIPVNLFLSLFLTLQDYDGDNFNWKKPLVALKTSVQLGRLSGTRPPVQTNPINYTGQKVNWPKSYLEIADSSLISTTVTQSVMLQIYYSSFKSVEKKDGKATFRNRT